ncbi:MAG: NUDIX domain-containing protein [Candidatus Omnitrophota bacterium]
MENYKFCPMCASGLKLGEIEGRDRLNCPKCGWIDYRNPLPVVACLVSSKKGELLLIKRNIEPCKGYWALPGGFIEADESIEEAGRRELLEETGLNGEAGRLVGAHVQESSMYGAVLMVGLEYTVEDEKTSPGDDAFEAKFIPRDQLPEIPFESHRRLIQEFHS